MSPTPAMRLVEINMQFKEFKEPGTVAPNVAFIIGGNEPARFFLTVLLDGGWHDETPFADGVICIPDFDDGIEHEVSRKNDIVGRTLEKGLDLTTTNVPPERLAVPNPLFDEETCKTLGIIFVVAVRAVTRLEVLNGFDSLQSRYSLLQV
jgi:hypothetical protein